jgi:aspartyl-tRNA(Asn)/glutamyl-tRNA(Gln) amidotransferase subunit B
VPLLEIVTEPDINSPEEAYNFLVTLKAILEYLEVSDCNMEEGSLRCDANISLRPKGNVVLGVKTEVKNMNSFKGVRNAFRFEIARQLKILDGGGKIAQETRLWDADKGITVSMRSKEEAHDYRYFPEPDLVPFEIAQSEVFELRKHLPELPQQRHTRFKEEYEIPAYDVQVLIQKKRLADFFEECVRLYPHPKTVSNWVMVEVLGILNPKGLEIEDVSLSPSGLAELLKLIESGTISGKIAKGVLKEALDKGINPAEIVKEKGLRQITDRDEIGQAIDKVIQENPSSVADYREGKEKALGFLIGQVMRITGGKANPKLVNEILKQKLKTVDVTD